MIQSAAMDERDETQTQNKLLKEGLLDRVSQWENTLLKTAYESLQKFVRQTQKSLEKEVQQVTVTIQQQIQQAEGSPPQEMVANLRVHLQRLEELKGKIQKATQLEKDYMNTIAVRIEHIMMPNQLMNSITKTSDADINRWYNVRLNRLIVDYLMRHGFYESATQLCKSENLEKLVDATVYKSSQRIVQSLQAKKCALALKWCGENRTKLRKLNSSLEFNLRAQEFIELVKANKRKQAIAYARKWFQTFSTTNAADIRKVMTTLAFSPSKTNPYASYFSEDRWDTLITLFKQDSCKLFGLPSTSSLLVDLQAGLAVLKTEQCFDATENLLNCPVCQPTFRKLSESLPFSRKEHSSLRCRITNKFMDDTNPPMALPNGYVYSKQALEAMAAQNDLGKITCPRTDSVYNFSQAKKIFIT